MTPMRWKMKCSAVPQVILLALLLCLFKTAFVLGANGGDDANERNCSIYSTEAGKMADCSHKALDQIPQDLPQDLVSLDLRHNSLVNLTNHSLSRYTNVTHLNLAANYELRHISPDAFEPLQQLKNLSFRHVRSLSFQTMFHCLHGLKGRSLSIIDFENAHFISRGLGNPVDLIVNSSLSSILAEVCVSYLSLRNNDILYMDFRPVSRGLFRNCIRSLDISNNGFKGGVEEFTFFASFLYLEYFSIAVDGTEAIHTRRDVLDPNPFNRNVTHINNSSVPIHLLFFPRTLSHLNISGVGRSFKLGNLIIPAPGLKMLSASRSGLKDFTHQIRGLEHLEEVDVAHCDLSVIAPEFFDTFPGLKRLNMSRGFLGQQFLLDWGQRLFQPLTQLREIDLSDNDLSQLPNAPFPTAQRVYLSGNRFSAVPIDVSKMPHLEELDLRFNGIVVLHESQMAALDGVVSQGRNLSLRLYGNPLACDCSALDFLTWLQTTGVRLDQDGDLPCLTGAKNYSNVSQVLAEAGGDLWRRCAAPFWLVFSSVGLLLLCIVAVLVWMVSKFSSQLQHLLLRWLNVGGRGRVRTDFHYDIYVAYNAEDVPLVYRELRGQLEDKGGVRLFLRERELQACVAPGSSVAEGIFGGITSCWRTLFVLTPHLLQDDWFDFMVGVAYQILDWRTPGRILLLLAGPVSMADVPQTLLSAVEEEDIFYLPEISENHPVWERLTDRILGKNRPPGA